MSPRARTYWALCASLLLHAAVLIWMPLVPTDIGSRLPSGSSEAIPALSPVVAISAYLVPTATLPVQGRPPSPASISSAASPTKDPLSRIPNIPRAKVVHPVGATTHTRATRQTIADSDTPVAPPVIPSSDVVTSTGNQLNMQLPAFRAPVRPIGSSAESGQPGPIPNERPALRSYHGPSHTDEWGHPSTTRLSENRNSQGDLRAEVVTPSGRYCLRAKASSRLQELRDSSSFDRAMNPTTCD